MNQKYLLSGLILIFISCFSFSSCSHGTINNVTENVSNGTKTENETQVKTKPDNSLNTYLSTFLGKINLETRTFDNLTADYANTDVNNLTSLLAFQSKLPVYIKTFTDLLNYYQTAPPKDAPADLLEAISLIKNGTGKIISGLNAINLAITERSPDGMVTGEGLVNDGNNLYNQGIAKYNALIDSRNRNQTK